METPEQWKEEAEKLRLRAEAAEARLLDEQRQREKDKKASGPTDFRTFLSICHNNMYEHLTIQKDPTLAATGMFTNVDSKYYPLFLKP
ncbi:hypothetical protein SCUCBS95973_004712 [Sporothrix curviconia]|uniref:Uncharacterized protein n=1 Tax=Sporothrix curviconia TaxID=1260050 RepID=A0ABP0BQW9_9PEZI